VLPFSIYWRLKLENRWIFPTDPCLRPRFGGNPLEFGDEIWRQKPRVLGLGEEIMPLAFFLLTQYRRVQTDGQTDTLRSQLPALALRRAGKNSTNDIPGCHVSSLNSSLMYTGLTNGGCDTSHIGLYHLLSGTMCASRNSRRCTYRDWLQSNGTSVYLILSEVTV